MNLLLLSLLLSLLLLLLLLLLSLHCGQFVLRGFKPHGQLLHEREEVVHGCGWRGGVWCKGGPGANLFQRQAGGFVGSEAGPGFEVEGAVAAFVMSWNLIRDCNWVGIGEI